MREMAITNRTTRTIIKGIMAVDTGVGMTITTDEEAFKVEVDILETGKIDCVSLSTVIHVLMRGIDTGNVHTKTELT